MKTEDKYSVDQLVKTVDFILDQDIIRILTNKDQLYTKKEIKALVDAYKKKEA